MLYGLKVWIWIELEFPERYRGGITLKLIGVIPVFPNE